MKKTKQIKTHLEYLGYNVVRHEENKDILFCTRPGYTSIMVTVNDVRAEFYGMYDINRIGKSNHNQVLSYVNDLNASSFVVTFYHKDDILNMYANYVGKYEQSNFTSFISVLENDLNDRLADMPDTQMFLGNPDKVDYSLQENYSSGALA